MTEKRPHLPEDDDARKRIPLATGLIDYFPDALVEVAALSFIANEQHNPGTPVHWDRSKSTDEDNTLMRHFFDRGLRDKDGVRHRAKVAWRALAALQKEIEEERMLKQTSCSACGALEGERHMQGCPAARPAAPWTPACDSLVGPCRCGQSH